MSSNQSETGKDSVQTSAGGITGSAELTPSDGRREPETITISLPALRAVLLQVIDDGYRCSKDCNMKHAWWFQTEKFHGDDPPSDKDIASRQKFCDKVEEHLRQLPARG